MTTNTKARKRALAFSRKAEAAAAHQDMLKRHAARKAAAEAGFTVLPDKPAVTVWHNYEDDLVRAADELGIDLSGVRS